MKRLVFLVLLLAIPLVAIEAMSRSALRYLETQNLTRFDVDAFARERFSEENYALFLKRAFHPELGWDSRPNGRTGARACDGSPLVYRYGPHGERVGERAGDGRGAGAALHDARVASYGDSFTHGDDVEQADTWQVRLGEALGVRVLNFGIGAYGTDQAVRKFARHAAQGLVLPHTILGVYEENILRIASTYRPFYQRESGAVYGFKPWISNGEGGPAFEANPNAEPRQSIAELIGLVRATERLDYWSSSRNVRIRFPYGWSLLRLAIDQRAVFLERLRSRLGASTTFGWGSIDLTTRMAFVLDSFVTIAKSVGTRPIIVFFPQIEGDRPGRTYAKFVETLQARMPDVTIVDVGAADLEDWSVYNPNAGRCHPSAEGHRTIAEQIRAKAFDG